jgi:hypothetical protein
MTSKISQAPPRPLTAATDKRLAALLPSLVAALPRQLHVQGRGTTGQNRAKPGCGVDVVVARGSSARMGGLS